MTLRSQRPFELPIEPNGQYRKISSAEDGTGVCSRKVNRQDFNLAIVITVFVTLLFVLLMKS
jgi:hypothetical protein